MRNYCKISFTYKSEIGRDIINDVLASELGEIGFESFSESANGLDAYIAESVYDAAVLEERLAAFPLENVTFRYEKEWIPDRDWNEEWEKNYFKPLIVDFKCMIRAPFHPPVPGMDYDIVIEPRMAFGTGQHETTYLMLKELMLLHLYDTQEEMSFLDMGCGTGVLAILAAMKRCKRVVAIDIDEWAYNNTLDNIRLNHTPQVEVKQGGAELLDGIEPFNYIFANINRNVLLNDIRYYVPALQSKGSLMMSGFYKEDIPLIKEECERNGLTYMSFAERNNWVAVRFAKI